MDTDNSHMVKQLEKLNKGKTMKAREQMWIHSAEVVTYLATWHTSPITLSVCPSWKAFRAQYSALL